MRSSGVVGTYLLASVVLLVGCYGGGGGGGTYTPLPAELFDGVAKSNRVARSLIRQQAEEIARGQPILDNAGTLGGVGHFAVDMRFTRSERRLPDVSGSPVIVTTEERDMLPMIEENGSVIGANVAMGFAPGFRLGDTRVLGIDLLAGGSVHSDASRAAVTVENNGRPWTLSFGARVGLVEESARLPGVAVSFMESRGADRSYGWTESVGSGSIRMTGRTSTTLRGWRLTAGKHLGPVGVTAGMGRDRFTGYSVSEATLGGQMDANSDAVHGVSWNWYGGLAYRLGPVSMVGELRHQRTSEDVRFVEAFNDQGSATRTLVSVGVKVGN